MPEGELDAAAANYDRAITEAGGLDIVLLGIGRNGHIAFNEPGSARESTTRVVTLSEATRADAIAAFAKRDSTPPTRAITMGIATILASSGIRFPLR